MSPQLVERVRSKLAAQDGLASAEAVAAAVAAEGGLRGDAQVLEVLGQLRQEFVGAGPLDPLLSDPAVTDVLVNAPGEVWVDRGGGLARAAVCFPDDAAVRRLAQRLAVAAGRRLDDAAPYVDARLPDGTRLHAVLPPISPGGVSLSLRVPPRRAFRIEQLVAAGSFGAEVAELLRLVVRCRVGFLICGGTGSGKTTLLSTLLGLVEPAERVILIEHDGELRPECAHVVRLQGRPPNVEGAGEVSLRDLVRQALRMRPDRLVVGEVRGPEVVDLLAAMNTGHDGGCGTVHANGANEVPARLEALGALAGLSRAALHSQLAAAVQVLIHLERGRDGCRRLAEVSLLAADADGLVRAAPAVRWQSGHAVPGPAATDLARLLSHRGAGPAELACAGLRW